MRADGSPVLYDWELFRQGVPGMRTSGRLPGGISTSAPTLDCRLDELMRDMSVAKVGTVVVLLAAQAQGDARVPSEYIAGLVKAVPVWIDESARHI